MSSNTTVDAFGLSPNGQLALTVTQCIVQGILIPLFSTFLSTRSTRSAAFTTYVVAINLLCLGQTAISIIQTADLLNSAPFREPVTANFAQFEICPLLIPLTFKLLLAYASHTVIIGTGVQAFFVDRCWRIFKKRLWPIIPFVLLALAGLAAGVLLVVSKSRLTMAILASEARPQDEALRGSLDNADKLLSRAVSVWAFSWFVLELGMTITIIFFLYRVRTGLSMHDGIFSTIWQILCTSITPPFILMTMVIVDGYITPGYLGVVAKISIASAAKFFTLSLMINLVGQGRVREKFNRLHLSPPNLSSNRPAGVISEAVFAREVTSAHSIEIERRRSTSDTESTRFGSLDVPHKHEREGSVEKCQIETIPPPGAEPCHSAQHISFLP
ncbi:hypothetical protein RHS04_04924 [Rhizoctonia solani]|uniref:Uncharacterized protein n=1 Tax=Rhizoctonia solani TaxID=456999 RepID=A0A8H7H7W8_9AGAM|nr:hypothetical protein RHS04_04924 [Rhizoctonia solani]